MNGEGDVENTQMLKWLWLVAGMVCGAILSSFAAEKSKIDDLTQRKTIHFTVSAVGMEDAIERSLEILEEKGIDKGQAIAALKPTCRAPASDEKPYECEARVVLAR